MKLASTNNRSNFENRSFWEHDTSFGPRSSTAMIQQVLTCWFQCSKWCSMGVVNVRLTVPWNWHSEEEPWLRMSNERNLNQIWAKEDTWQVSNVTVKCWEAATRLSSCQEFPFKRRVKWMLNFCGLRSEKDCSYFEESFRKRNAAFITDMNACYPASMITQLNIYPIVKQNLKNERNSVKFEAQISNHDSSKRDHFQIVDHSNPWSHTYYAAVLIIEVQ